MRLFTGMLGRTCFLILLVLIPSAFADEGASLRGIVKDTSENLIGNANLQFHCDFAYEFPATANQFGTFSMDDLPQGRCRIFARYKDSVGMQDVTLSANEATDVEIVLDKKILTEGESTFFIVLMVLIAGMAIGVGAWLIQKRMKRSDKSTSKSTVPSNKVHSLGQRGKDIYNTLNAREKQIVDFLLTQRDYTVQSKIHKTLGIAKSSLFRTINSLESKKVITATKTAKARRLKLSDWFMEN